MKRPVVLSLYEFTGEALRPWAEAGYECYGFDKQHDNTKKETFPSGGSITYRYADLHHTSTLIEIYREFKGQRCAMAMGFPVCTDLAVCGAKHFAAKRKVDPLFQVKAAGHAKRCALLFKLLGCPYFVENPVSVLSTLWRKPDYIFNPYEYGGYIPQDQGPHPRWPEYIMPFDAYPKKTCLWTGGGFVMPTPKPVEVPKGYSKQFKMLGGKNDRTKNIRSATPRGFARAVMLANTGSTKEEAA